MTPLAWLLVALGVLAGVGIGILSTHRKAKTETTARTLVPARTRQMLAVMPGGAAVIRRDRRNAYCNSTALALGVARPDGALHPELARLAERAWGSGEVIEEDIEIKRGVLASSRILHARVQVLDNELALALINDRTEQNAAEQMRRNFAINVSHELKTPVGAIQLLAETLEMGADDPDVVRNFTKKLRKEAKRLGVLIQEIIEITRLQSDEAVLDAVPVGLAEIIEEAIDSEATAAGAKNITIVNDARSEPVVVANHDLLVMAVRNLLANAIHYSENGKRVTVSCTADDDVASISVVDQGIGIAPAQTERIFERFYRVDPARSRESGGTGLGLSIVKHIALRHDGAVDVWSQLGVGSTFTIKLPIGSAELPPEGTS